ncbi:MAG: insulinase family protein [Actinobacteria bacterium]|nr:insulinase family protein [Actinomycetota bacterium]
MPGGHLSRPPPGPGGAGRRHHDLGHDPRRHQWLLPGPVPARQHRVRRRRLSVLNQLLGGGMSSRLFQEIREKRGLVYSVYSYRAAYLETGLLAVYAGTSPARATTVLDLISAELDRLLQDEVPERELAVARGHVKGSIVLALEETSSRMSRIGRSQLVHGEVMSLDELVERTAAVSAADVRRVIERVVAGPRTLAVVGPFSEDAFSEQVA